MPIKGATAALGAVKDTLLWLHDDPPAKAADLAPLRHTIAALIEVIDDQLRLGKPDPKPVDRT